MFEADVIAAIKAHAIAAYPNESCGIVTPDGYVGFDNVAEDPRTEFECTEQAAPYVQDEKVLAVIHSHPDGPYHPSAVDMAQQQLWEVPWGLVAANATTATDVLFWGDTVPPSPLLGRNFRHGPSGTDNKGDCYALIRDYIRFAKDVILPEFPRDWEWWLHEEDLYANGFAKAGFIRIGADEAEPGDVFLATLRSPVINHGGILLDGGHILHHLQNRFSRIDVLGNWKKYISMWVRHVGDS